MKRAASHLAALQGLLDRDITVAMVSEDLHAVDASDAVDGVRARLEEHGYDECGVRRGERVHEYVERTSVVTGTLTSESLRHQSAALKMFAVELVKLLQKTTDGVEQQLQAEGVANAG